MERESKQDVKLDETDIAILKQVEQNSEINLEELSRELDVSKSAVHYRLKKLKKEDIITSISANVNPISFGLNMLIITEVSVVHETDYATDIGKALSEIDGIYQVYYTMGDTDFIVLSRVQNRDQMNELINTIIKIDGVNETSSRFVMQKFKTGDGTIANMSDKMINNTID